jgi:hypothetical protein
MKTAVLAIQFLVASVVAPGQIDIICSGDDCDVLAVQNGSVILIQGGPFPIRGPDLGKYLSAAQPLVPRTEAPVRDLRSPGGWRVIASVYLDHAKRHPSLHLRFLGPDGRLKATTSVLPATVETKVGDLFGGGDEIFAVTSFEQHVYNTQTGIWFLPALGEPKELLAVLGGIKEFHGAAAGGVPGVMIARQTYDGIHAETKGTVNEFYTWNRDTKALSPPVGR